MRQPKEKQPSRLRRWFGLKRVLALNVALFALFAWSFSGELVRDRDVQERIEQLQAEADELTAKNSELAELGRRLNDASTLEREARLKLNLRKPGEEVVVIKDAADAPAAFAAGDGMPSSVGAEGAPGATPRDGPQSNAAKWWQYFFR